MFYRKFQPSAALRPFVECYYIWEGSPLSGQLLTVESPPSGFGSLVFNYGAEYQLQTEKYASLTVPTAFLAGQATRSYRLLLRGPIGMVGAVFRPAGLSSLFGLPMYEFTDGRVDLTDVLGNAVRLVEEQIDEAADPARRIGVLEAFLSRQLLRTENQTDRTDYVANRIVEQRGVVNIYELMDELYVCRRQFERKFLHKVGVSPKYYARIRRIGFLCAQLASSRWNVQDWHDLIYQTGYYDQSHFIREFSGFMGRSPSQYVRNNVELARFLEA